MPPWGSTTILNETDKRIESMHRGDERRLYTADGENRRSTRFQREPGTEFASVTLPNELSKLVEVFDESLGGIGLLVMDRYGFRLGLRLEIDFAGATFTGAVCHVTKRENLGFVIGVRQEPTEPLH